MQIPGTASSSRSTTNKPLDYQQGLTRGAILGAVGTLLALGGIAGTLLAAAAGPAHIPATAAAPQLVAPVPAVAPAGIVPPAVLDPAVASPARPPALSVPASVPAMPVPASAPVSAATVGTLTAALPGVESAGCTDSVLSSALGTFVKHVDSAHLRESPFQQVGDLLNTDQYVKTHTVLLDNMLQPLLSALPGILDGATTSFIQHVDAAHLQESPFQQLADLLKTDQYVKTHTVLAQNMLTNLFMSLSTNCGTPMPAMPMPMPVVVAPAPAPAGPPSPAAPPASAPKASVTIANYAFSPGSVQVAIGTTVTWKNTDQVAHTVDSSTSAFSSGLLNPGSSYSHTFTRSGTYRYSCAVHPDMVGTIVVS